MSRRVRILCALAALLLAATSASACRRPAPAPRAPASSATSQTATPTSEPAVAPSDETAEQAAGRIFADLYETALALAQNPADLQGAKPGRPVAISRDYSAGGPVLAQWVLPSETKAISRNMFAEMRPSPMSKTTLLVPVIKGGRTITEFEIRRDDTGAWDVVGDLAQPFPSGAMRDLEAAAAKLRRALGPGTRVRPAVFLPSGLVFAVGDNASHEAVVFLLPARQGPGVAGFTTPFPDADQVLYPSQLADLYRANSKPKAPTRDAPGGLD